MCRIKSLGMEVYSSSLVVAKANIAYQELKILRTTKSYKIILCHEVTRALYICVY